ncbi:MAG: ABC transporter substrate-binding protein [Deltaproteobacteria bacterium]|nr:MAG: ABC transporter substrate-binding protein [Deltaproteobacteria bacterium]
MLQNFLCRTIALLLLIFGFAASSLAGEPTDHIRKTTDKMINILHDPVLKNNLEERRKMLRNAVNERFDWREMAQRSLADHWKSLSEEERKEFIPLFTDLLENTYMNRIENYSGDKVNYEDEKVQGNYSLVKVTIFTDKQVEIPVVYKMKKKGQEWMIYDVSIEGVSLVKNYRQQFDSVILSSSYQGLVEKLKEKVAKN